MTVESDYAMAMASDWFKNLAPVFQPIGSKTKNQSHFVRATFPSIVSK